MKGVHTITWFTQSAQILMSNGNVNEDMFRGVVGEKSRRNRKLQFSDRQL